MSAVRVTDHADGNEPLGREFDLGGFYKRYWGELCSYLRHKIGLGPPEPEDIAQATFVKFAAAPARENIINPRALLYATARNLVLDHHRHQRHRDDHVHDVLHTAEHQILYELSPERVLLDRERVQMLSEALARLPAKRRRIILLSRFEGLSHAEIAARFGISTANVQKQVERALAQCHRHMNAAGKKRTKR